MTLWERKNGLYVAADKSLVRRVPPVGSEWSPVEWNSDKIFEYDIANAVVVGGKATTLVNTAPLYGVDAVQLNVARQPAYTASYAPFNNKPAIHFAGSHYFDLTGVSAPTSNWSLCFVINNAEAPPTTTQYFFDQSFPRNLVTLSSNVAAVSAIYDGSWRYFTTWPTYACWIVTADATSYRTYINGVADVLNPVAGTTRAFGSTVSLGAYFAGTSDYVENCYVAYAMGLKKTLTSAEVAQFTSWSQTTYTTP